MAKASKPTKSTIRCAIYTRKSSEDGLEQDFNSLDAQREACESYIRSQKQEGWVALPAFYDDGGLSGGDTDRPALTRLLADIAEGKIDTVVVYKVDRLTRSLADFAKIVDVFDHQQVAFVAVTQQFNTTTSMGRLTLKMLLSFAQFEREVTAERIRDKIAASKKKGMWMGGVPPLGYDIDDKKLVVNDAEAETVRHIFERYDAEIFNAIEAYIDDIGERKKVIEQAATLAKRWAELDPGARKTMLQTIVHRIEIHLGNVILKIRPQRLAEVVDPAPDPTTAATCEDRDSICLTIPARLKRSGLAMTLKIDGGAPARTPDRSLLRLLTLAERYRDSVLQGQGKSIKDLAAEAGVGTSYFARVFRIGFLAPDITKAILQGRQPQSLTAKRLSTEIRISPSWTEQRKQLGFS